MPPTPTNIVCELEKKYGEVTPLVFLSNKETGVTTGTESRPECDFYSER